MGYVLKGKLSIVGAPIREISQPPPSCLYKPGLTGIVQVNKSKINNPSDEEQYELFYLKNYSLWLDLEIIMKIMVE